MKTFRKSAVVLLAVLIAGAARIPFERSLMEELRAAKLLPQPLRIGVGEKLGQTGAAVALGGLRTLVATFLNLRAFTAFTDQRWRDVENTYDLVVDLAPQTEYYWLTGSWHLAYNAGSFYQHDKDLPPLRRQEMWRTYVHKGRAFLERGIRNNPGNWRLNMELGSMLIDDFKTAAFGDPAETYAAAAEAYRAAADTGQANLFASRALFYALARVPGREDEAISLGEKLFQTRVNRTPTVRTVLYALHLKRDPSQDADALYHRLFESEERAYAALSDLWRGREGYPVDGVASRLRELESKLGIPPSNSVLVPR